MGTKQELIANLNGAITLGKQNLAAGGVDTTNIHSIYGVVKAIPDIEAPAAKNLVAINVTTLPTKTVYSKGDNFDSTGMEVTAIYSNNETEDVTSSVTLTAVDLSTIGEKLVTVTYEEEDEEKTDSFNIFVNEKAGINWVNNKLIVTAADVANMTRIPTNSNPCYVQVSNDDTLIRPEDNYIYTLGYTDFKSVDWTTNNRSDQEAPYGTVMPFWNMFTKEKKDSSGILYHQIGADTANPNIYLIHKTGTVINNQSFAKGLWIKFDTSANIPFTVLRTSTEEALKDIVIDPSAIYIEDNYCTLTETTGPDIPSYIASSFSPKTFTGYKVSDNFLPIMNGIITTDRTYEFKGDSSGVKHFYDAENHKFGHCSYNKWNQSNPFVISVSEDNTSVILSTKKITSYPEDSDPVTTIYYNILTIPYKGTYVFCDTLTEITTKVIGLAVYANGTFDGDVPLGVVTDYFVAATTQDFTSISYYDYDGVPADSITLQNSTVLNTSRKGASFFVDAAQAFGSDLPVDIDGTSISVTGASLTQDLIKDQQRIGPYSYFYTYSQDAAEPKTKIFAYINDFYLNDGTFVRNPGVYTSLSNLHIKLDLNAQT